VGGGLLTGAGVRLTQSILKLSEVEFLGGCGTAALTVEFLDSRGTYLCSRYLQ
jgi:hypothetical protein